MYVQIQTVLRGEESVSFFFEVHKPLGQELDHLEGSNFACWHINRDIA